MRDFIEHLRAKPDHVRKQIAFGASLGITGTVALMWAVAFMSSGALMRSPEPTDSGITSALSEQKGASLLGAIGALTTQEDGSIMVVGTSASSTGKSEAPDERTVIPF